VSSAIGVEVVRAAHAAISNQNRPGRRRGMVRWDAGVVARRCTKGKAKRERREFVRYSGVLRLRNPRPSSRLPATAFAIRDFAILSSREHVIPRSCERAIRQSSNYAITREAETDEGMFP